MGRALRFWVSLVQAKARLAIAIAVAGGIVCVLFAATSLGFKTSRSDLIDPRDETYANWVRFTQEFGDDADIIATVEGPDRSRVIAALETLARDFSAQPQHFEKTCHRINVDRLRSKGLYQLPLESVRRVAAKVDQMTPLLLGGWQLLSVENMLSAARLTIATLPADREADAAAMELLVTAAALLESVATSLEQPNLYRSPWRAAFADLVPQHGAEMPDYFFSRDGKLGFLRTIPIKNAKSFTGFSEPVRVARALVARAAAGFPDLKFGLTGLPVLEDDEMQAAQKASGKSSILSIVGVAALFFVGFRSFRHPMLALCCLGLSGCWTLGWITLTVGHFNILSVAFIVTLIGLGIDYGIVWLAQYESERALGDDNLGANMAAASKAAPGIVTSAATTAVAFLTTISTGFLGLAEMGWIAAGGILICTIGTFTILPALLTVFGAKSCRNHDGIRCEQPVWPGLERRPRLVLAALGCAALLLAAGIYRVRIDYNLLNMQSQKLASVQLEHELIERTGSSGFYALAVADSAEDAIELRHRFEKLPSVGRVIELASLVPPDQSAKTPILSGIHSALAWLPKSGKAPATGVSSVEGLMDQWKALAQIPLPASGPQRQWVGSIHESAARLQAICAKISRSDLERRIGRFEQRWSADLIEQLRELHAVSKPEPVENDDLPVVLKERYRSPNGKWLVQIFPKECVWDMRPLRTFVTELQSVDPRVTGHPVTAMNSLLQMTQGYQKSAALALAVIFASVLLDFRSLSMALLAMTPLLFGCACMLGLMGWTGLSFNPANTIALPLILGVGVNYGVYVMHDRRRMIGREFSICRRLARAVSLSAGTSIVGFSSLICADHWGMISIGLVLSIGIGFCLVFALFFLPALIRALDGRKETAEQPILLPFPSPAEIRRDANAA